MPAPATDDAREPPTLKLGGAAGAAPSRATDGFTALDRSRNEIRFYPGSVLLICGSDREEVRCDYADIGHLELWRPHRIVVELGARHPQGPRRLHLFSGRFRLEDRFHNACALIEAQDPPQFSSLDDGELHLLHPIQPEDLFDGPKTRVVRCAPDQQLLTDEGSYRWTRAPGARGGILAADVRQGDHAPLLFVDGRALHNAHGSVFAWVRILSTGARLLEWANDETLELCARSATVRRNGQRIGTLSPRHGRTSLLLDEPAREAPLIALLATLQVPSPPPDFYDAQSTEPASALEVPLRVPLAMASIAPLICAGIYGAAFAAVASPALAAMIVIVATIHFGMSHAHLRRHIGRPRFFEHHALLPPTTLRIGTPGPIRIGLRDIGRIETVGDHIEIDVVLDSAVETRRLRPRMNPKDAEARILAHLHEHAPGHVVGAFRDELAYHGGTWSWEDLYAAFGTTREITCSFEAPRASIVAGELEFSCQERDAGTLVLHRHAGTEERMLEIGRRGIRGHNGMLLATIDRSADGTTVRTGSGAGGEKFEVRGDGRVVNGPTEVAALHVLGQKILLRATPPIATALGLVFLLEFLALQRQPQSAASAQAS